MRAVLVVAWLSSRARTRTDSGSVAPMKIVAGNITATANSTSVQVVSEAGMSGPIQAYTPTDNTPTATCVSEKAMAARSRCSATLPARPPPSAIPVRKAASMVAKA